MHRLRGAIWIVRKALDRQLDDCDALLVNLSASGTRTLITFAGARLGSSKARYPPNAPWTLDLRNHAMYAK